MVFSISSLICSGDIFCYFKIAPNVCILAIIQTYNFFKNLKINTKYYKYELRQYPIVNV